MFRFKKKFWTPLRKKYSSNPVISEITENPLAYSMSNLIASIKEYIFNSNLKELDEELYEIFAVGEDENTGYRKDNIYRSFQTHNTDWQPSRDLIDLLCFYAFDMEYQKCVEEGLMKNYVKESLMMDNLKEFYLLKTKRDSKESTSHKHTEQTENTNPIIAPFDTSAGNYNILILPFRDPDNNYEITSLGRNLEDGLTEKNNLNKLGLQVRYEHSFTDKIKPEDAKSIGKKLNANMVIWGNDSRPTKELSHYIYFHYVIITKGILSEKIPWEGKTEKLEITRLIEITEGSLHLEIDDIIYWFLGNNFYFKANYENALNNFNKIKNDKYLSDDLFFYKANCFYLLNDVERAKDAIETALNINPNHINALNNYAVWLADKFNDPHSAIIKIEKALKLDPNDGNTHFVYALLLKNHFGDYKKAEEHYLIAIETNAYDFAAHFNYGVLLLTKLNQRGKARKHFKIALSIYPSSVHAQYNYAAFLLLEGFQFRNEARKHFEIALQLDPNAAITHNHYGKLLERQFNEYEKARKHYEEAVRLNPQYIHAYQNLALLFWLKLGNPVKAKEYWETILKINPNLATRHYNYAIFLVSQKEYNNARMHYETALKIDPDFAEANYNYARLILFLFREKELAEKHYRKAIVLNPSLKNEEMERFLK